MRAVREMPNASRDHPMGRLCRDVGDTGTALRMRSPLFARAHPGAAAGGKGA